MRPAPRTRSLGLHPTLTPCALDHTIPRCWQTKPPSRAVAIAAFGADWAWIRRPAFVVYDPTPYRQTYAPPNDRIRIQTNERRLFSLADRLWERAAPSPSGEDGRHRELEFALFVVRDRGDRPAADDGESWTIEPEHHSLDFAGSLKLRIEFHPPRVTGQVSESLLATRPADVARLLLEAPGAGLLSRRGCMVAHAGVVVGPAGAVVIRGGSGAGKSTLVAAAHRAGFGVLGDEAVLVARDDCDELAAAVRDLTVMPDVARLLGIEAITEPTGVGGQQKRRIDLFATSTPAVRRARRVTTVLLGERDRSPAQLVPLPASQFVAAFRIGEIVQERWAGDPDQLARDWGERGGYRLDGAADLSGALRLLQQLTGLSRTVQRAS